MTFAPFLAVSIACAGAIACAVFFGQRFVASLVRARALDPGQRRTVAKGAVAFGLVALGPAFLLGPVVGGTLGAAYGPLGIALGTFAVVALLLCASVAAGAHAGRIMAGGPS